MEFNEKLQKLRSQRGLTQEQLAQKLYVSRTAISKWESGRGYPNIESLKAIASFFCVTVDELISSDEVLELAEQEGKQRERRVRDLAFGVADVLMILLLFLPFFAQKEKDIIRSVSLMALDGVQPYVTISYFAVIVCVVAMGAMTLAMQSCQAPVWVKSKRKLSLVLGSVAVLLFIVGLQPYAAVFALILLAVKVLTLIKLK